MRLFQQIVCHLPVVLLHVHKAVVRSMIFTLLNPISANPPESSEPDNLLNMAPRRRRAPLICAANDPDPESSEQCPQEKVVETTELLENILSYLPTKGLLACRELLKRFKGVIDGSFILRETMFLRPTRAASEAWRLNAPAKGFHSVRPVAGMIPLAGENTHHQLKPSPPMPHLTRTPAILNPIFPFKPNHGFRREPDWIYTSDIVHRISRGSPNQQDRHLDMYLTQPPCRQVWVEAWVTIPQGPYNRSEVHCLSCNGFLELGAGITIRDLANVASTVRGVVSVIRLAPKPSPKKRRWTHIHWAPKKPTRRRRLEPEYFDDATLLEVLRSLDLEDAAPSANEVQAGVVCWLIDTVIPTDEIWAGVAPYTENNSQ